MIIYFQNIIKGTKARAIACDFMKDELRSNSKVDEWKTRIVSSLPVEVIIAYRMFFACYEDEQATDYIRSWCNAGINPLSPDWKAFRDSMGERDPDRNPVTYALDAKFWDKSLREWTSLAHDECVLSFFDDEPSVDEFVYDEEFRFITGHEDTIRKAILQDCSTNIHIVGGGHIIATENHGPSGAPNTVTHNSLCLMIWTYCILCENFSSGSILFLILNTLSNGVSCSQTLARIKLLTSMEYLTLL
uniref:RNA-dependent RNA polymerase n=1 Tax=Picornavirales sp. TaxID=1955153 RepID=A0A514D783_9VIRU|nr:MAG: RNA-dependent RNA polymerase [Picornavirales sp.]